MRARIFFRRIETFRHLFSDSKSDFSLIYRAFAIYHVHANIESEIPPRFIASSSKWGLQEPLGLLSIISTRPSCNAFVSIDSTAFILSQGTISLSLFLSSFHLFCFSFLPLVSISFFSLFFLPSRVPRCDSHFGYLFLSSAPVVA